MTDPTSERRSAAQPADDSRPRPQYGEYATPEEQRARIRQPGAAAALEAGHAPRDLPRAPAPRLPVAPPPARPAPTPTLTAARRRADLVVTLVLLGYGLINVILTIGQVLDFPAFAQQFMTIAGIDGQFTNVASGGRWGTIAAVVFAAGWLLTALLVFLRARRGRRVWWIPLVGAAVSFVAFTSCIMVPLLGDPVISGALVPR